MNRLGESGLKYGCAYLQVMVYRAAEKASQLCLVFFRSDVDYGYNSLESGDKVFDFHSLKAVKRPFKIGVIT